MNDLMPPRPPWVYFWKGPVFRASSKYMREITIGYLQIPNMMSGGERKKAEKIANYEEFVK